MKKGNRSTKNARQGKQVYEFALQIAKHKPRRKQLVIELLKYSAALGNSNASNALGVWYRDGIGVKKDSTKAFMFFKKANKGGNPDAAMNLGYSYANGIGTRVDFAKSKILYKIAADRGVVAAQSYLGSCYLSGLNSFVKSPNLAFLYFKKAAKAGDIESIYGLGYCYELGKGTKCNISKALKYYKMAANQGHAKAKKATQQLRLGSSLKK